MAATTIYCGLRRLDFDSREPAPGENSQASVEFAREAPLQPGESVHIPLGVRDGRLRALIGVPKLVGKKAAASSFQNEYLYRITGLISELPLDGEQMLPARSGDVSTVHE